MDVFSFQPMNGGSPFAHLGQEHAVAYDPAAPADEVKDAGSRLASIYASEMDASKPDVRRMMEEVAAFRGLVDAETTAQRLGDKLFHKALSIARPESAQPKSRTEPLDSALSGDGFFRWLPKKGLQFRALRAFSERLEVAQAIHRTRIRQVQSFLEPSDDVSVPGFRLVHVDRRHELVPAEEEFLVWVTKFLLCGGRDFDPLTRRRLGRQTLSKFGSLLVDDALTLDNAAVELVGFEGLNDLRLSAFFARDGSGFYRANVGPTVDEGEPFAFQVVDGIEAVPFKPEELAIFTRNDSSWLERNGYGRSEFEASLDTLNCILQALAHTKAGLQEDSIPRGILMAYGNFDRSSQEALKAAWQAKQRGAQNSRGMPVLFSRGQQGSVQYLQTGAPFEEMAFARWISFQYSVMGGIYGIAPEEVGIDSFSAEKSSLSGSDTAEKLAAAKDKGLKPFMRSLASFLSDEIVARYAPWARLEFTGLLDEDLEKRRADQSSTETINERRTRLGMSKHPLGWFGDLPADPGMLSAEFQRLQAVMTVGEGRQVWGGLTAYPDPNLNNAPLNPSLQAVYNQGLQAAAAQDGGDGGEGAEGAGDDPWAALGGAGGPDGGKAGEGAEDGEDEQAGPAGPAPGGAGEQVKQRLGFLGGKPGEAQAAPGGDDEEAQ